NRTFKISHQMEKLPAGAVAERPPAPPAPPPDEEPPTAGGPGPFGPRRPPARTLPPPPPSAEQEPATERRPAGGTLELNVQPADAEVSVDGRPWRGSGQERQAIDLSEGRH